MKKLLIAISLFCSLASSMASAQTVTHIIYVIKENRSFDNYFGTFKGYSTPAGWQGVQSYCSGGSSPVYPNQAVCHYGNPTNECSSYGGDCPEPISFSKYSGNPYSLYLEDAATTYADVSHAHSQLLSYNDNGLQDAYPTTGCPNSGGTATVNPCGYAYFDGAQIGRKPARNLLLLREEIRPLGQLLRHQHSFFCWTLLHFCRTRSWTVG